MKCACIDPMVWRGATTGPTRHMRELCGRCGCKIGSKEEQLIPSCGDTGCANCKGAFIPMLVACPHRADDAYASGIHSSPDERKRYIDSRLTDPRDVDLSSRLAEMNRHVHAMKPRSRERSLYAMTIYQAIDDARAKPLSSNTKFAAYERADARA